MAYKRRVKREPLRWHRMDLHIHTPASNDYLEPDVSYLDILRKAELCGLDVIAFTDHNTVAGITALRREVEKLQFLEELGRIEPDEQQKLNEYRRLSEKILLLPGFELTATLGFHILGIFPPETPIRRLEHVLLSLRVPPQLLDEGSTEVGATVDVLTAYRIINEAGGLAIAAHANAAHGVAMQGLNFGGQTKIAYTQDPNLHALEVTDLESRRRNRTANFYNGSKPEYPRRMHCIQGSDAHRINRDASDKNRLGIGDRMTEIQVKEPSFPAIKQVLMSKDFSKIRPFRATQDPFDYVLASRQDGRNIVQDFYETLARRGGHLDSIIKDVCAFANTNGGTIYVGVSHNPNQPATGISQIDEAEDTLRSEIEKSISPPLEVQIEQQETQGKKILQLAVPQGDDAPYVIDECQVYVRDEGETNVAVRDEIVALVKRTLKQTKELNLLNAATPAQTESAEPAQTKPRRSKKRSEPKPAVAVAEPESTTPEVVAEDTGNTPKTGVEIAFREERKGKTYYSLRDMRNGNVVHNVTKRSARKLWQYAIIEHESNPLERNILWEGDIGVLKVHRRGDQVRFDLVERDDRGHIHCYYGVTYEGIDGPWLPLIERAEGETAKPDDNSAQAETPASVEAETVADNDSDAPQVEASDDASEDDELPAADTTVTEEKA